MEQIGIPSLSNIDVVLTVDIRDLIVGNVGQ